MNAAAAQPYLIGTGMSDVTGPLVGVPLWGFGRPDQVGEGLHIRLRSRAFVIAEADNPGQRLVFVSADLGSVDHHVTLEVVERLQARYGASYTLDNVIISATHTHAGPGGYWHSRTATGLDGGLYPAHFEAIASGITASIVQAHENLQPGNILVNAGTVPDAGANRSLVAYRENPAQERARYSSNTNRQMLLLKFLGNNGAIGLINWYALHPTAMNYHNLLVSGDHKGYAALKMEQRYGATYESEDDFVAAFAQADPGDVTPNTNLDNTGPGATDVETTQIMGERQLLVAQQLFDSASDALRGPVATRRIYVDLSDYKVDGRFTGSGTQRTCPSAYGYSFAGGSTEDGGAHFLFREGMLEQRVWLDWLIRTVTGAPRWTDSVKACQAPKPILFETGTGNPPLQSQVRSFTLARVGQLVIIAVPAEVTTMAGRRLRASVKGALGEWAQHFVLAGYANGFAGYITTPEEYMLQQYEGAHTLHGRWSLPAYQQILSSLATALDSGAAVSSPEVYDDWRSKAEGMPLPAGERSAPRSGVRMGEPLDFAGERFEPGATVSVKFWSSNPTAHFGKAGNFLTVETATDSGWQKLLNDADWNTRVRWLEERGSTVAEVSWIIPADAAPGSYRIRHLGYADGGPYSGTTRAFEVRAREH